MATTSFALLRAAADGMEAQREALQIDARNVAAAQAAGPKGSYERLVPQFRLVEDDDGTPRIRYAGARPQRGGEADMLTEMVSVLNASRAFEANASIFDIGKRLAERTIDMGKV
jgi:flagellar basal body rod protein FlgC